MSRVEVRVVPVRWVEEDWPGWIEVELTDAARDVHQIIDKVPVFTCLDLVPSDGLPTELWIDATSLRFEPESVVLTLSHHVARADGLNTFSVGTVDVRQPHHDVQP